MYIRFLLGMGKLNDNKLRVNLGQFFNHITFEKYII